MINPLVNWIWMGIGIVLIGTFIALLPERTFAFAAANVPAGAATTSLVILLLVFGGSAGVRAQHTGSASSTLTIAPKSALEKQLDDEIVCMCGGCGRKRLGECLACDTSAKMRAEVAGLVAQGKTHDEIINHFVAEYGSQEVLSQPINKGFNRLVWLLPYGTGVSGVLLLGLAAVRFSKRAAPKPQPDLPRVSPELEQRLDDELRDLD
jgi:cytochrome c-type biogenesis protein CcmH/NrfF